MLHWEDYYCEKKPLSNKRAAFIFLVPKAGVEPARACAHTALNRARLPVSPLRRFKFQVGRIYHIGFFLSSTRSVLATG
jgi:hypothetical protein